MGRTLIVAVVLSDEVMSSIMTLKSCVHFRTGSSVMSMVLSSILVAIPLTLNLSFSKRSIVPYVSEKLSGQLTLKPRNHGLIGWSSSPRIILRRFSTTSAGL